ncbi:MAG: leucine-rich repeat protein [Oscillospiraceae bacterium]|nr:leucine-rich repeat protein [Oscillospiraceae bacterium]
MIKKRICGFGLAAAVACQVILPAFPSVTASAAAERVCSLDEFSEDVREVMRTDADRQFYDSIVYDAQAGTLSADGGKPVSGCGDLRIKNGELMLRTDGDAASGTAWESFADAAEDWGYETAQQNGRMTITNEFQTARLIVKAEGGIDRHGAVSAAEGYRGLHILQYADSAAAYSAYQAYLSDPAVEYVQPSHRITLDAEALADAQAEVSGNAQVADVESGVYNSWGVPLIGTEDFIKKYLDAEVLPDVTVAVIDTGINPVPALFQGRILEDGINISDSGDDSVNDDLYHGTHVTGTICEMTPKNVKILPIKVFDENGSASDEQIYLGLMYAIEKNADIVNMSFGGLGVSPLEIEAMTIADEAGMICCAAAGNNGDDAGYYYPGSIASCITVGAVTQDMERATFSNFGKFVDVVAPGFGIRSYVLGEDSHLEAKNGTSMATPHVSACCALLRSYDKKMTPQRAEMLLRLNAKDLGPEGFDKDFGWGFINMEKFRWDDGICPAPEFSVESGNFGQAQEVEITVDLDDAEIWYTTDGTKPSPENGTRYEKPLTVAETTRILAVTARKGWIGSAAAEAVYTINGKDVSEAYTVKDGVLVSYRGIRKKVTVPDQYDGKPLREVAADAFAGNHFAEEIQLPSSVKKIGDRAFANCSELVRIFATGAEELGEEAFADCEKLHEVQLADGVKTVGEGAFRGCTALMRLDLEGLQTLPESVFEDCAMLKTVHLPHVTVIGENAFRNCIALTEPEIYWQHVTAVGSRAFENCTAWEGDVRFSALETLGTAVFSGDIMLRSVMLPETFTVLPTDCFYRCTGLRQLDLPGITKIESGALATQTGRMQLLYSIDYAKITYVGTNAFSGCMLGSGLDTLRFDALEKLEYRAFGGAIAGTLEFPKLTEVGDASFADAQIDCVRLEHAEKLSARSLTGARSVYLTNQLQSAADSAFAQNAYIVSDAPVSAVKLLAEMKFCDEPLVLRRSSEKTVLTQHDAGALRVLACGNALQYQWYSVSGETQTPVEGAVMPELYPDTSAAGEFTYRCVMTDAQGKTEQVTFSVSVTESETLPELHPDQFCEPSGSGRAMWTVIPAESGTYRISASGAAAVSGVLTDAAGQVLGMLKSQAAGGELLEAELTKDKPCYLRTEALWKDDYALFLTSAAPAEIDIAACTLQVTVQRACEFGSGYQPEVAVRQPGGTKLIPEQDYVLRYTRHNQEVRILAYGIGRCCGCGETSVTVYERIPQDTPVPVQIGYEKEEAVYIFVPQTTGKYRFYGNATAGYAEEQAAFNRSGRYAGGQNHVGIKTECWIADTPEHDDKIFAQSDYSTSSGSYFNSTVMLNAGQSYYIVCTGSVGADYALVISAERYDLSEATVTGGFMASYEPGEYHFPRIKVRHGETVLEEGVDYQRIDNRNDIPGLAEITLVGMGKYYGKLVKQYEMIYESPAVSETMLALDTPVEVSCSDSRLETLWFKVDQCKTENETIRYRVLNERISGSMMLYTLYRYDETLHTCARVKQMNGEQNDYLLGNGTYIIAVARQYPETAAKAKFSVLIPYSVTDAELIVTDQPYTGSEVPIPVKLRNADGTELQSGKDFRIVYKDSNIMLGEQPFALYATNRTYGYQEGVVNIYPALPADAPLLAVGEHSVKVTKQDRLAVYRVTPETETEYVLCTSDVADIVLRVFSPEGEMLEQDYGAGTKSVRFTVPAGETRFVMVKFNGTAREGTISFRLETSLRLLSECEITAEPHVWTGEVIAPQVTFKDGDYTLIEGTDYRLRYTADDVNIGTATANYTGLGKYFGNCDVEFEIIPEQLKEAEFFDPVPLALDESYRFNKKEQQYVVFSYTSGIDAELNASFYEAMCKLTVQCYDSEGNFLQYIFFKTTGEMKQNVKAGETIYFVVSATDISSRNQTFCLLLHDDGSTHMRRVQDQAGGFGYRIAAEGGYAEAYEVLSGKRDSYQLLPEIEGVPVTFVPESLFADLPAEKVVIGYEGCAAADYADRYGFIYQQARSPEHEPVKGDLNGDGKCSAADITVFSALLAEHTGLDPELIPFDAADLNGDAILDIQDLFALMRLIVQA